MFKLNLFCKIYIFNDENYTKFIGSRTTAQIYDRIIINKD